MEIIVGKTSGFCYGVKRAVTGTLSENNDNLYALGELVHNETVVNNLRDKGIILIEDINDAPDNCNLIIRAHGVSKEVYDIASKKNINIIDYTCPNVLKIHDIVKDNNSKFIILCGSSIHPENIGTISYAKNYYIIDDVNDIDKAISAYQDSNIKELVLVSQTTYSISKFEIIKDKLLSKYKDMEIFNTICKTTELRQKETEELSKTVDAMVIIGGKNSSNTKKLYEVAIKNHNNVYLISDETEIDKLSFDKIGIMAGASTPEEVINKVVNKLKGIEE